MPVPTLPAEIITTILSEAIKNIQRYTQAAAHQNDYGTFIDTERILALSKIKLGLLSKQFLSLVPAAYCEDRVLQVRIVANGNSVFGMANRFSHNLPASNLIQENARLLELHVSLASKGEMEGAALGVRYIVGNCRKVGRVASRFL